MTVPFPNESPEYRAARDALLAQEVALRRQMESVAAARRALPLGGVVPEDYVFDGSDAHGKLVQVAFSQLFAPDVPSLAVYSMMFPRDPRDHRRAATSGSTASLPLHEGPCPSCTALLDQLDGAVEHVAPRVPLVVVAKAPIERVVAFAKERGWRRLRFLSSAKNHYNRDYHAETADGVQQPMLNVFSRDGASIRHFWGAEMLYAQADPGQDPRHVGTLEPMWNLFDLTREGRGTDFEEQMQYPTGRGCGHC